MPLYVVATQAGSLSNEAKAKLAGELTILHAENADVLKNHGGRQRATSSAPTH